MGVIRTNDTLFTFVLFTILSVVSLSGFALAQADDNFGFTVDLIHRDSPNSPFFNASETPSTRWANALHRSANRVKLFRQARMISPESAITPLFSGSLHGTYLISMSIGSPAIETTLVVDTASQLTWTNCQGCPEYGCFEQSSPLFDPKASSTYQNVSCDSKLCQSLIDYYACDSGYCHYIVEYGDESRTAGTLATDTVGLVSTDGQPVFVTNIPIGCATYSQGNFEGTGIAALGKGPLSLINRMYPLIGGRFSYCIVPHFSEYTSKIHFGSDAVLSGPEVMSTPLNYGDPYNYNFTLEGITVQGKRLPGGNPWSTQSINNSTTIFIDSGTTLTVLPSIVYEMLEAEVREFVHVKAEDGGSVSYEDGYPLCYQGNSLPRIPRITMHFTGADIELDPVNIFTALPNNYICFAFAGTADDFAVYGNTQQINFLIGYDLQRQTLSFKKTDCTTYAN